MSSTAPAAADAAPSLLHTRDVDGTSVDVYSAELPSGDPCLTYVTRGRQSRGKPDLVMTLATGADSNAPASDEALAMPIMSAAIAGGARGAELTPWSWLEIGPGVLGREDMVAVAAVPARAPSGIDVAEGSLALIPLTRDELAISKMHGVPRVAAMLARAQHEHPAPWWIDRGRPTAATAKQHAREAWILLTASFQPGITAFLDIPGEPVLLPRSSGAPGGWYLEGTWRLRVTPTSAGVLADILERASPRWENGIAMPPDELSGDTFVWVPGGVGPQLARRGEDTSRPAVVLLSFYLFNAQTGAQLVDDGVWIWLSGDQRDAVVSALRNGSDVTIEPPSKGMMPWRLEWNRP